MLLLYALAMTQLVMFVVTTYIAARIVGARIHTIVLGTPAVLRVRRANPEVRIGPLPNAFVDFKREETSGDPDALLPLSMSARLLLALAPWVVVLAISMICLGPIPALQTFARGFWQVVVVVDVTPYVRQMIEVAHAAPLAVTGGILFAKLAAMNLVPFGGTAGGAVIRALVTRDRRANAALDRYMGVTMLAWIVWTLARFGWALVHVARE